LKLFLHPDFLAEGTCFIKPFLQGRVLSFSFKTQSVPRVSKVMVEKRVRSVLQLERLALLGLLSAPPRETTRVLPKVGVVD